MRIGRAIRIFPTYRTGSAKGEWEERAGKFISLCLPKLIQRVMKTDTQVIIEAFGNEEGHQT